VPRAACFGAVLRRLTFRPLRGHEPPLKRHFDDGQIVEIVATIALFGYLNRWNDTMATDLEAHPAKVAERTLGEAGWEAGKHGVG